MKKLFYLIVFCIFVFLFSGNVEAREATCTYSPQGMKSPTVTVTIGDDDSFSVEYSDKSYTLKNYTTIAHFETDEIGDNGKKALECKEPIYVYVYNTGNNKTVTVAPSGSNSTPYYLDGTRSHVINEYKSDSDIAKLQCPYGKYMVTKTTTSVEYNFKPDCNSVDHSNFKITTKCPENIYLMINSDKTCTVSTEYMEGANKIKYNNSSDNKDDHQNDDTDDNIHYTSGCAIISEDLRAWLNQLLSIVKIGGLVLTIILGMFDFVKASASGDNDAVKKVWKTFSRRLIAVVILFLAPVIINFIFDIININGVDPNNPLCNIG